MKSVPRTIRNACLTVVLLSTTVASAQCVDGSCTVGGAPAVVRVVHTLGPCRSYGSGTIVRDDGRQAVVLSCAHLFRGGTGKVQVRLPDGRTVDARPTTIDTTWDLSALEIDSVGITPVGLATAAPKPGQWLQSCGFGPNGVYQCNTGTAQGYVSGSKGGTHETLCLTGSARDGDSGGPVLNQHGELVGVLWGTDGRTVHATYCGRIRKFLANLLPNRGTPWRPVPGLETPAAPPPLNLDRAPTWPGKQPLPKLPAVDNTKPTPETSGTADMESPLARAMDRIAERQAGRSQEADETPSSPAATSGILASTARLVATWAPFALAACGMAVPPVGAVGVGIWALRLLVARRRRTRTEQPPSGGALNDRYASQLNAVFALSGRSTTADATLGREYDRELAEAENGSGDVARWARMLRRKVADKFYRIHDSSPTPADPIAG